MSRYLCIILFFLTASSHSFAQAGSNKMNTVYVELGGNGLFLSANYERQIFKITPLNIHVGVGIYGITPSYVTLPFGINYLLKLRKTNSFIDIGFGATYTKADVQLYSMVEHRDNNYINSNFIIIIPSIGIRHQTNKNYMYRFSFTPVFNQYDGLPYVGFSIGKSF